MLKKDGKLIMIDPFHKWSYLARAKFSCPQIILYMSELGFECIFKSGVLFWPYREFLSNSKLKDSAVEFFFKQGEFLLKIFGKHLWSDHKVLVFQKKNNRL